MKPLTVLRLDLRSPIVYRSAPSLRPFVRADRIEERLFCFGLAEEQYQSMEGEDAAYLGDLLFAGAQSLDTESPSAGITLPQGTYMFAQVEELLDRPTFIAVARAVQQEGLRQGIKAGKRLYLRYLTEGEKTLSQVFSPYTPS